MTDRMDLSLDDIIKMNKKEKASKTTKKTRDIKKAGPKTGRTRPQQQLTTSNKKQSPVILHVSNLHYKVNGNDMIALFSTQGKIKRATVHYDEEGRSLGTAEVIYETRESALRAIKKYNEIPLDGRPMRIAMVAGDMNVRSPNAKSRLGVKAGSGIYKSSPRKQAGVNKTSRKPQVTNKNPRFNTKRTGGKPNTRSQRPQKKTVTAEELDAELDAYTRKSSP